MSEDTISRIDQFSIDNIFTPNSYVYEIESLNKNYRNQGSGPYINLAVEVFTDVPFSTKPGVAGRREEGVAVYEIFDTKGSGKRSLAQIRDKILAKFIVPANPSKQRKLFPTGSEKGTITFYQISQRPAVDVSRSGSRHDWRRLDVLVSYTKYYDVT